MSGNPITDYNVTQELPQLIELYTDETYYSAKHWDAQFDVPAFKEWKISFNNKVSLQSVTNENLLVFDDAGNLVPVTVQLGADEKSILVKPPMEGYKQGMTYRLLIGNQVKSSRGKMLIEPVLMKFTIQSN